MGDWGFLLYAMLIEVAIFFVLANIVTLMILGISSYKYPNYFINKYFILGSILGTTFTQYVNILAPIFVVC
ncbi:hypothetical protein LS66_003120 [Helicobacter sp. MIT 03-1614]|uniref:hypothetical protein n=1 Tax=Helicobacter sp. MIT 03-1614 TaxID=1548147 RepID=UPI000513BE8B|nr:hypothetical protein [Helicobacter sp. MIT 03-1614]TLD90474.1 hypothetical protein LS66_003120 [Helicobacter sp. MIT 03-1614]